MKKIKLSIAVVLMLGSNYVMADKCAAQKFETVKLETSACKDLLGGLSNKDYRDNFVKNILNGDGDSLEFGMSNPLVGNCSFGSLDFPGWPGLGSFGSVDDLVSGIQNSMCEVVKGFTEDTLSDAQSMIDAANDVVSLEGSAFDAVVQADGETDESLLDKGKDYLIDKGEDYLKNKIGNIVN